jgi:hypothetical protein
LGSSVMDSFRESRGKKEITISNGCCQKWGWKFTVATDLTFQIHVPLGVARLAR